MTIVIDAATERDLAAVRGLLERRRLPLDGVDDCVQTMLVAREGARIVGTAALEFHADQALLRSVAVDAGKQGRGLGRRLTERALQLARSHGVRDVYLLTTTAERFFPKFGFERIAREEVPPSVQDSVEFRTACPASAVVMRKRLAVAPGTGTLKTILFACVHNAGRSQMAAAWFNLLADPARARAISAGTEPGPCVHPEVVTAMGEVGLELAGAPTSRLTPELAQHAHMLVTMGCRDQCPVVPGLAQDDWPLEDPKDKPMARVREIRDEIRQRIETLIEREGWSPS
jgi:arsenate reductase